MILDDALILGALGGRDSGAGAVALAGLVRDTVAAGVERRVLVFRPAHLSPAHRQGRHLAMLHGSCDALRRTSRTRIFDLPRGGFVAVEAPPAHHLAETERSLTDMLDPQEARASVSLLRLPDQAAAVLAAIEEALGLTAAVRAAAGPHRGGAPDGQAIAAAERALASADVSVFLRRGKVHRLVPGGGAPEPLHEDRHLSMPDVRDAVLPGADLAAAPGLVRRLRRLLDRRLLAGLARPEELRSIGPLCLALGVDAVTSPDFLRLDALWPAALRGALTIALAAEDAATDPAGFAFARDLLVARGHRPMLDAGGPVAALSVPPGRAGIGLLRLRWSDALPAFGSPAMEALRAAFPAEPDSVVLSGVDRPAAIAWGWEMGITLFQGRLMDGRRPA